MRDEQDRPARIKRESGGRTSRHARLVNMLRFSVILPVAAGFPSCFAAMAARRDGCNPAFIKTLGRSAATSLTCNKPTRTPRLFEMGRDTYRNILDLLRERRDRKGDLLI